MSAKKPGLLLLFFHVPNLLLAQVKRIGMPFTRNYDTTSIQAGSQTWMIDISPDGLAYFANSDGVVEFSGLNW